MSRLLITVIVVCVTLPGAAADIVVYTQPYSSGIAYASQCDWSSGGIGCFATVYDNFSFASNTSITKLAWTGYVDTTVNNITSFTVSFWSNNAGQPGSLLLSDTIAGNANQTLVPGAPWNYVFNYSATLPIAFSAVGGTEYWMSVVANQPSVFPQWFWSEGTGGNDVSYQDTLGYRRDSLAADRTFSLFGPQVAVPEPATLLIVASGLLVGYRRFRRM